MRIPDEVRRCVGFVCEKTTNNGDPTPKGTAFFLSHKDLENACVVTCRHNIERIRDNGLDGKVHVRLNFKGRGPQFVETNVADWHFHPTDTKVDVAVMPLSMGLVHQTDLLVFEIEGIATPEKIERHAIGVGDEVVSTGLFASHYGQHKNIPVVRVGNIACMREEPVDCDWAKGPIDAYLIESRSIGGLSGSPVFVQLGPVYKDGDSFKVGSNRSGPFFLLGMIHGHWSFPVSEGGDLPAVTLDFLETDNAKRKSVNSGLAIVVPIDLVVEVMEQPGLAAHWDYQRRLRRGTDQSFVMADWKGAATQS